MSPFSPIVQTLKTTFIKLLMQSDIFSKLIFKQNYTIASSFLNSSPLKLALTYQIAFATISHTVCLYV